MDLDDFREKANMNTQIQVQYGNSQSKEELAKTVIKKSREFKKEDFSFSHSTSMKWSGYKKLLKLVEKYKEEVKADKSFPYYETSD